MIGRLTGVLEPGGVDWALVDVNGVGYVVHCSARTLARLPPRAVATLLVETHVREDQITLYGFASPAEQEWFRALTQIQGVGGRVALAILGVLGPDELVQAIAAQDVASLRRADGVGAKLATRIASELKSKVGDLKLGSTALAALAAAPPEGAAGDAVSALVNLGYRRAEAFGAVARAGERIGDAASFEMLVREGLRELAPAAP